MFLRALMWRNSKGDVQDEIGLPPQQERIDRLRFSAVEAHFYRCEQASFLPIVGSGLSLGLECCFRSLKKTSGSRQQVRIDRLRFSAVEAHFYRYEQAPYSAKAGSCLSLGSSLDLPLFRVFWLRSVALGSNYAALLGRRGPLLQLRISLSLASSCAWFLLKFSEDI